MFNEDIDQLNAAFNTGSRNILPKEKTPGISVTGTITDVKVKDATDYTTREVQTWKDGTPKKQVWITVQTTLQNDPDDDGMRTAYINLWGVQKQALDKAVQASGTKQPSEIICPGSRFTIIYHGQKTITTKEGRQLTANDYEYHLTKGIPQAGELNNAFTPQTPKTTPQPTPNTDSSEVSDEQIRALINAGCTDATITASLPGISSDRIAAIREATTSSFT